MKNQKRNFRMFKKRIAVMDVYQEYRRSHERVKVMLSEGFEDLDDQQESSLSAQENLHRFIREHETKSMKVDRQPEEVKYVNLAEDTILRSNTEPIEPAYENDSFYPMNENLSEKEKFNANSLEFQNSDNNITNNANFNNESANVSGNIDNELEKIIRDAFYNFQPNSNLRSSDVDPELLNLMKDFLIKKPIRAGDNSQSFYSFDNQDPDSYLRPDFSTEYAQDEPIANNSLQEESSYLDQGITNLPDADVLERQIQNQQNPPKVPSSLRDSTPNVKRQSSETFESSSVHFEDDSSLAITKKELSLQVKNLIKETLENNQNEENKPNDLLELERQLKEHIEKIKQSRHENER